MRRLLFLFLPAALLLAACAPAAPAAASQPEVPTVVAVQATSTPEADTAAGSDLHRVDEQGAVVIEVTPSNLDTPSDVLEFEVAMNTHSVNLSMDLAALSTLTTDTGVTVQASKWDAPPGGGHHVSGKLIFPATQNGKSILEGASKLTLTITNVDAPSRLFEWQLK